MRAMLSVLSAVGVLLCGCGGDAAPVAQTGASPDPPAKTVVTIIERSADTSGTKRGGSGGDGSNGGGGSTGEIDRVPSFRFCDRNIQAREGTTTCGFAQGTFYEYWASGRSPSVRVYSESTGQNVTMSCLASGGGEVVCRGGAGAAVRFPPSAVDAYSPELAQAYARSHRVNGSPYGYEGE